MKTPQGWTDFYVRVGDISVGLRWRVVLNRSAFSESQVNQLIVLTLLKMGFRLPRSHPVEFKLPQTECKTATAHHYGMMTGKHRWSSIAINKVGDGTISIFNAAQLMASLAHELEHARQWAKKIGNSKPGFHGDYHERTAARAAEHMLVHLVSDDSAITELHATVEGKE